VLLGELVVKRDRLLLVEARSRQRVDLVDVPPR